MAWEAALLRHVTEQLEKLAAVRVALLALDQPAPTTTPRRAAKRKVGRGNKATGTKAVILDVLATASAPMSLKDIARAAKITAPNAGFHVRQLVRAGDVVMRGGGKTTQYAIG